MSDVCSFWTLLPERTKADDDERDCHADRASLTSSRSLEDANPRVGIPSAKNLFFNVLDDQHVGNDCYETQAAIDNGGS